MQYIRTKPPEVNLKAELQEIGFSAVLIGNKVYECWGYERKKKKVTDKGIIVLKQIRTYKDGQWEQVDVAPMATTLPLAVYHSLTRYIECEAR